MHLAEIHTGFFIKQSNIISSEDSGLHYSDVMSAPLYLKLPVFSLCVQQLVQIGNSENIKTLHYWPFVWLGHW